MLRSPQKIGHVRTGNRTLSLCMIVKNEAQTLEQCLRLAWPHVDEVVVVDTGSTDGTQEIARRYADVFEQIPWPNSFALARNYSFDLASGTFILILDGDEYIPEDLHWRRLRKALRQPDLAAVQVPVRNLLGTHHILAADRVWQERVVRNHPQLRYAGRVHNQIQEALAAFVERTGQRVIRVEAEVIHTGYALDREQMMEKYRPRLHLLRAEYEHPRSEHHRAYYAYQLGVALFILEELEEAAEVFSSISYPLLSKQNAFYTHLLAAQTGLRLNKAPMALVHCNAMLTLDRTEPIAYYLTGLALLASKQGGDGMLMLLEAFNVNEARGLSIRFLLNPAVLLRVLADLCGRAGLKEQAAAFTALQQEDHFDPRVVKALIATIKTGIVRAEMAKSA